MAQVHARPLPLFTPLVCLEKYEVEDVDGGGEDAASSSLGEVWDLLFTSGSQSTSLSESTVLSIEWNTHY